MNESIRTLKAITGAVFVVASLPVYIGLIVRDITENGRYRNSRDEIFYISDRPTPNTIDFPNGPKTDRSFTYSKWVKKTFSA